MEEEGRLCSGHPHLLVLDCLLFFVVQLSLQVLNTVLHVANVSKACASSPRSMLRNKPVRRPAATTLTFKDNRSDSDSWYCVLTRCRLPAMSVVSSSSSAILAAASAFVCSRALGIRRQLARASIYPGAPRP